jgi:hypothetical protein
MHDDETARDSSIAVAAATPAEPVSERPIQLLLVDDLEMRVGVHESGTSAVANFVDDRGREQRVSLVARQGGGALTTCVPKRYEEAMKTLGQMLWPDSGWAHRRSGVYRV